MPLSLPSQRSRNNFPCYQKLECLWERQENPLAFEQKYDRIECRRAPFWEGPALPLYRFSSGNQREFLFDTEKKENTMAYKISNDCVSCGTCAGECPVSAISEGEGQFNIDANACLDCGACAGVCPVGAISQE